MILYLDNSCLVKLYVEEEGSGDVGRQVVEATAVATSAVAYAEARAAFARKNTEGGFTEEEYRCVLEDFLQEWAAYLTIDASRAIIALAGDLAERHVLRGFDAIHLASALALRDRAHSSVVFCCADERLNAAAASEGLDIPERNGG